MPPLSYFGAMAARVRGDRREITPPARLAAAREPDPPNGPELRGDATESRPLATPPGTLDRPPVPGTEPVTIVASRAHPELPPPVRPGLPPTVQEPSDGGVVESGSETRALPPEPSPPTRSSVRAERVPADEVLAPRVASDPVPSGARAHPPGVQAAATPAPAHRTAVDGGARASREAAVVTALNSALEWVSARRPARSPPREVPQGSKPLPGSGPPLAPIAARSEAPAAVHIGSIDVHIEPPPRPARARPEGRAQTPETKRIARGFTTSLGMRQGT